MVCFAAVFSHATLHPDPRSCSMLRGLFLPPPPFYCLNKVAVNLCIIGPGARPLNLFHLQGAHRGVLQPCI